MGVPDGVTVGVALAFVTAGDDCVEFGRAALRPGLVMGVAELAVLALVVEGAGECRAFVVVVATSGFRGEVLMAAGEAGELTERAARRGGGVAREFEMLAASRGLRGGGLDPLGLSLIVVIVDSV